MPPAGKGRRPFAIPLNGWRLGSQVFGFGLLKPAALVIGAAGFHISEAAYCALWLNPWHNADSNGSARV